MENIGGNQKNDDVSHFFVQEDMPQIENKEIKPLERKKAPCKFLTNKGICEKGRNCNFKHDLIQCASYDNGFCIKGNACEHLHIKKELCMDYSYGFCPKGPECTKAHPKLFFEFDQKFLEDLKKTVIVCHFCKDIGHKSNKCTKKMYSNVDLFCESCQLYHRPNFTCPSSDQYKKRFM